MYRMYYQKLRREWTTKNFTSGIQFFKDIADIIIDGGPGGIIPSTVIDCTKEEYEVVRMGAGAWEE